MAGAKVIGLTKAMRGMEREIADYLNDAAEVYYQEVRKVTPVKSGNAKRNWSKSSSKDSFVVENRVPYIERLEEGWSKQAPRGMTRPTLRAAKRRLK